MPVNISFPGHRKELAKLFNLRRVNRKVLRSMKFGNEDPFKAAVINVTEELGKRWEQTAPRLTGTLASATRQQYRDKEGRVFIDSGVRNPVFGGRPSTYGPIVHKRQPWVSNLVRRHAPGILVTEGKRLIRALERQYEGAK